VLHNTNSHLVGYRSYFVLIPIAGITNLINRGINMKKSQLLGVVCAGVVTLLASVTANASIVYSLNRTIGAGTVTGFIETDGTIGVLGSANITDWMLTLNAPNLRDGPTVVINASDIGASIVVFDGTALSASTTALTFNFSAPGSTNSIIFVDNGNIHGWGINQCFSGFNRECIWRDATLANTDAESVARTGAIDIGVSAVPVPAAAWLFGSGLLGLVGMARRKKAA